MDKIIEFSLRHWQLVVAFIGLAIAIIFVETKRAGATISSAQAVQLMNRSEALVLDLRERQEFIEGHITHSMNIPATHVPDRLVELQGYKDKPVILVCKMGQHSGHIGKMLHKAGFSQVYRLASGMSGWQADGLPLIKDLNK